jgi:acyl-CoA dehydrogenase
MSQLFPMSERVAALDAKLAAFMGEHVYPAEAAFADWDEDPQRRWTVPPILEELKAKARAAGLWNLFLPDPRHGAGLTNLEYAGLAERMGRSLIASEIFNCSAPDTGNMEVLHQFGNGEQKARWLEPLLRGEIRSAFAMTEPAVASSDATNISLPIARDGDFFVLNGRKWWTTGGGDPRCAVLIVMGVTQPQAAPHRRQSMVLVPMHTPGVKVVRPLRVFGFDDAPQGHVEIAFDNVRVPVANLIHEDGSGFEIAQARLGPGRIHHCMRALGAAERALHHLVQRSKGRVAFGKPLAEQGVVQQQIAESRIAIDQARLLCRLAAKTIDELGNKAAAPYVSAAKVSVPRVALEVIDRAIQVHGGAGVSDDVPLAAMYGWHRAMRIFDGPDEVHLRTIAKSELRR